MQSLRRIDCSINSRTGIALADLLTRALLTRYIPSGARWLPLWYLVIQTQTFTVEPTNPASCFPPDIVSSWLPLLFTFSRVCGPKQGHFTSLMHLSIWRSIVDTITTLFKKVAEMSEIGWIHMDNSIWPHQENSERHPTVISILYCEFWQLVKWLWGSGNSACHIWWEHFDVPTTSEGLIYGTCGLCVRLGC